jgi:hypothetical protein
MKTLIKSIAVFALAIITSSCSNDTYSEENLGDAPLVSYSLSRSEDGTYTLEETLASGEVSTTIVPLVNNEVKIDFETQNSTSIAGLSILDEKVNTKKGVSNKTKVDLKSYKLKKLHNGSYDLKFKVAGFIVPEFSYNEEHSRYEILLNEGDNNGVVKYSKNYTKFEGEKLQIVFVHVNKNTTLSKNSKVVGPPVLEMW